VPLDSVDFAYICRICAILSLVRQYFHFFLLSSGALKPGKTLLDRLDCALRRGAYIAHSSSSSRSRSCLPNMHRTHRPLIHSAVRYLKPRKIWNDRRHWATLRGATKSRRLSLLLKGGDTRSQDRLNSGYFDSNAASISQSVESCTIIKSPKLLFICLAASG
jgi:hypothetical protein